MCHNWRLRTHGFRATAATFFTLRDLVFVVVLLVVGKVSSNKRSKILVVLWECGVWRGVGLIRGAFKLNKEISM